MSRNALFATAMMACGLLAFVVLVLGLPEWLSAGAPAATPGALGTVSSQTNTIVVLERSTYIEYEEPTFIEP